MPPSGEDHDKGGVFPMTQEQTLGRLQDATLELFPPPKIRVPPPIEDAAFEGKSFKCPYCFNIIKIRSQPDWEYVGMYARNSMVC